MDEGVIVLQCYFNLESGILDIAMTTAHCGRFECWVQMVSPLSDGLMSIYTVFLPQALCKDSEKEHAD